MLLVLLYRGWERHVGPGPFVWGWWGFEAGRLAFLALLAVIGPLSLFLLAGGEAGKGRKGRVLRTLGHLSVAGAVAAVLGEHLLLLAVGCALVTWCAAGAVLLEGPGEERTRYLAALFPLMASDLCLMLSVLLINGAAPKALFHNIPVAPGIRSPAFPLLLAAALLRLGVFPLTTCPAFLAGRGKAFRIPYLQVINPVLGAYLLFMAVRVVFNPGGEWLWAMMGIGAAGLVSSALALLRSIPLGVRRGWLANCLGAAFTFSLSSGGQGGAVAARLVLMAGIPALLLLEASDGGRRGGARTVGGAAILGLPPLAGFASLWMAGRSPAYGQGGAMGTTFFLGWPVMVLAFLAGGAAALIAGGGEADGAPPWVSAAVALPLCAFLAITGIFPGRVADMLMREYGLPLEFPFSSWSSLAGACLLVLGVLAFLWWARGRRVAGMAAVALTSCAPASTATALLPWPLAPRRPGKSLVRAVVALDLAVFLGWWGMFILSVLR